jgi:hypothetical protein
MFCNILLYMKYYYAVLSILSLSLSVFAEIDIIIIIMSRLKLTQRIFQFNIQCFFTWNFRFDLIWLKLISTHCSTLKSCGSTWVILGAKMTCNYPVIGFKTTPILSSILLHTHWYDLFDDGVSNFLGFFFLICFHISITDRKMSVLITNWLYH